MRRAAAGLVAFAIGFTALGCGGPPPPKKPAFDTTRAHWEDAFDRVPDILVVAHPRALGKDPMYGPLLKNLSRMIASRAPQTAGTRVVEVFESCDEVIFGLRQRGADDAVIVLRGVRADIDEHKLVDDHGRTMWNDAPGPRGPVVEMVRQGVADASLFTLPERTWVVALGAARARAREAFAHPFDRPRPTKDDQALFLVRLDGPSLVQGVPRLRSRGAALEPVGRSLDAITLALRPGKEGLVATFAYSEEGASAFAEVVLKQVVDALGREGSDRTKWLGETKVDRQASTVVARVNLPPKLLEDLPTVSAAELGF